MKSIFFMGLLLVCESAFSQQDTAPRMLNQVIVTAQRMENQLLLVPYSAEVLTAQQLRQFNPRTTPEALTNVNGVFIQKTNHGGGSAFLRGLTGNQTLMMVDGIRLNNSTFRYGPNQYLNTVSSLSLERIEVIKGTGSVQYGSDALGGVIQVVTHDPQFSGNKKWFGAASGRFITKGMENSLNARIDHASGNIAGSLSIAYRNFGDLVGGDTTGRQNPSGYNEWSTDAKLKFRAGEKAVITFAQQLVIQRHLPVYHKVTLENFALNEFDPQQRMLNYARYSLQGPTKWFRKFEFTAVLQQTKEGRNSRKNGSNALREEEDKVTTKALIAQMLSAPAAWWTANSGLDIYIDKVRSTTADLNTSDNTTKHRRGLYPDRSRYSSYSLYSLHQITRGRFIIDAGARFNLFRISIPDTTLGKTIIKPSALVGNIGVVYKVAKGHSVYSSFSSGFRTPNVDDMGTLGIVDFRYEVPALHLKPERSRHAEVGYKFSTPRLEGSIAGYYMHLGDLITRTKITGQFINNYQVYKKENIERAFIRGAEAELYAWFFRRLRVGGFIASAYGQNLTRNEPLRRIPPLNGKVLASYRLNRLLVTGECQFAAAQRRLAQGDKDDNRIPAGGTPGWQVINFHAQYTWKQVELGMSLLNIFNMDYRTHGSGINGMGRAALMAVQYKF